MGKDDRLEYLEDERKKIWKRLLDLEDQLKKKTSDYEAEAKISAEISKSYTDDTEKAADAVSQHLSEASSKLEIIREHYNSFEEMFATIKESAQLSIANSKSIGAIQESVENIAETINDQVQEFQKVLDSKPILDEKLARLQEIFDKGSDYDTKLGSLHKSINDRKKEIDELYYEIIGYTEKDEDGEETEVKGRKSELEETYNSLKQNFNETKKEIISWREELVGIYEEFTSEKKDEFSKTISNWKNEYSRALEKIENLLPNALTTGLSYAYSEKKQAEEIENEKHRGSFNNAIFGLVSISLIPFVVSIVSLFQDTSLDEVITRVPRIVLAILPLYLPVLWVAYSANKKMNLAKRLIEEYSHKEVLSKTFEGLSKQIDTINDQGISSDLRIKLLYNILEVNSENPGKLISNYNKSDHPLMDALEKSIKLTNAVDKLSKIPGFSKLASSLEKKSKELLKVESQKAELALETLDEEKTSKKNGEH